MKTRVLAVAICLTVPFAFVAAQQPSNQLQVRTKGSATTCPMHNENAHDSAPSASMNARGEKAMGFSQTVTTHHFLIKPDGGVIQVEVNNPTDTTNRDNIRKHLRHIAQAFRDGDFDIPMFVHGTVPPGVPEMRRLREKTSYSFEETPAGGRVVITMADRESVTALHKFLRFQIEEHKTGDPTPTTE